MNHYSGRQQHASKSPLSRAPGEGVGVTGFSEGKPQETQLHRLLAEQSTISIATAESCTGGNIAARLTSVAGSSAYVLGGIVAYSNPAKAALLGVPEDILDSFGAVSSECAQAMADGARRAFGATVVVATTGIAGPGGATARKPVGLVYIAVSSTETTVAAEYHFPGDRAAVTLAATDTALDLLVQAVHDHLATPERRSTLSR